MYVSVYGQGNEDGPYIRIMWNGQWIKGVHPVGDGILTSRDEFLDTLLEDNLPTDAGYHDCDCEEYCDSSHGEGPLEYQFVRLSAHEVAEATIEWEKLNATNTDSAVHTSGTQLAANKSAAVRRREVGPDGKRR